METIKDMLIRHEGMMLKPYLDSEGIETIGVGRNLKDVGISREEAIVLLENDIQKAVKDAQTFPWYEKLNNPRKTVIINMLFNIGLTRFFGFKKMIEALGKGDYKEASIQMLDSKWAKQVGKRATELSAIMASGEMP